MFVLMRSWLSLVQQEESADDAWSGFLSFGIAFWICISLLMWTRSFLAYYIIYEGLGSFVALRTEFCLEILLQLIADICSFSIYVTCPCHVIVTIFVNVNPCFRCHNVIMLRRGAGWLIRIVRMLVRMREGVRGSLWQKLIELKGGEFIQISYHL